MNVSRFKDGNKTAVFFLNDIHSGAKFANGNLSLDRKEYNFKVAQERMKLYCGYLETCLHTSFYSHGVSNIVFSALGDNLEAILANMRNGQFLTMDLFGHEQVEALVGLIVMALVTLVNNSKVPIHVVFTPGNHDRAVRDKSYESENILIAWIAQAVYFRTKELTGEGFERVTIDIAAPTANILLPNGVELILKHGHREALIPCQTLSWLRLELLMAEGILSELFTFKVIIILLNQLIAMGPMVTSALLSVEILVIT